MFVLWYNKTRGDFLDYKKKLNKEQLEAVEFKTGPALIVAGAGTGKTSTLIYRVVNLIESGVSPENILLLTFTNKAANEMVLRINKALGVNETEITACTYHSFCTLMLRKYAHKIGLNNNFQIIDIPDAVEALKLLKEKEGFGKIKDFPRGKDLVSMFSISTNKEIPLIDVIDLDYPNFSYYFNDILNLKEKYTEYKLEKNILDYDDLLLYFLKLLREKDGVCKYLSDIYKYIMVDEYQDSNNLQFNILYELRKYENKNILVVGDEMQCFPKGTKVFTNHGEKKIEDIKLDDYLVVASGKGTTNICKPEKILKKYYKGKLIKIKTAMGTTLSATPEHITFVKKSFKYNLSDLYFTLFGGTQVKGNEFNHLLFLNNKREYFSNYDTAINYSKDIVNKNENVKFIQNAKLTENNNDFEFKEFKDIKINDKIAIIKNNKIIEDVVIAITSIDYDDFVYDINVPLYRNYIANKVVVHNCIYGFRGANFKNILNFPSKFKGCKVIKLVKNYRSNQEILDVANEVVKSSKESYDKRLVGLKPKGDKPLLVKLRDSDSEAKYVVSKIRNYKKSGVSLDDILVLIRNSRDSAMLEAMMLKYNIAYQKFGGTKLMEKAHIKNIFAFLKLTINIEDEISWFRIFQLYPNIGTVYAKKLTEKISENGIEELKDDKYKKKKYGQSLPEIFDTINNLNKLPLDKQLEFLINDYYFELTERTILKSNKNDTTKSELLYNNKENKEESQVLFEFANGYKSTNSFLTDLTLETPTAQTDEECITISTVHSAKGLEYKIGFIINCVEGSFPCIRQPKITGPIANKKIEEMVEEERRIFYVAVTRVKEDLYITYPETLCKYGQTERTELGRFLLENNIKGKLFNNIKAVIN